MNHDKLSLDLAILHKFTFLLNFTFIIMSSNAGGGECRFLDSNSRLEMAEVFPLRSVPSISFSPFSVVGLDKVFVLGGGSSSLLVD